MPPASRDPQPTDDPLVCFCMRVRHSTLRAAIAAGARTLDALQAATRAGTGCGTCRIDLLELLDAGTCADTGRRG